MTLTGSATARRRLCAAARPGTALLLAALLAVAGCSVSKRVQGAGAGGPSASGRTTHGGPVPLRVVLVESQAVPRLGCTGPYRLLAPGDGSVILELSAGDTTDAVARDGGVAYAVAGVSGQLDALVLAPRRAGDLLLWDGRPWRGLLRVAPAATEGLMVVNEVELEDYLAGVVPLEIGRGRSGRDLAAVEAQAVAARTYAFARLGERRARAFDLYADTRDQVYGGVQVEDATASAAVAATGGLVLHHAGRPISAFFHANCGGHTAAKDAVWPVAADPVLRGVRDTRPDGRPWCADGRRAQWRQSWTWTELEGVLQRSLPEYLDDVSAPARARWATDAFRAAGAASDARRPGPLRSLRVAETSPDGRVAVLEVVTASGVYRVRGGRIRWVLRRADASRALLRSTLFELEVDQGRRVTVVGRGHGHGLGLCQDGAVARARAGQSFGDILAHYYPGARLAPIAEEDLP